MNTTKPSTKEVNLLAGNYILNAISWDGYDIENEPATDKERLQFLFDTFNKEFVYPQNLHRYGSIQNVFREWIQGLPSCFNIVFTYYDIIGLAKSWGTLKEDASEAESDKICANYFNFIANKTFQLFKKYKIA